MWNKTVHTDKVIYDNRLNIHFKIWSFVGLPGKLTSIRDTLSTGRYIRSSRFFAHWHLPAYRGLLHKNENSVSCPGSWQNWSKFTDKQKQSSSWREIYNNSWCGSLKIGYKTIHLPFLLVPKPNCTEPIRVDDTQWACSKYLVSTCRMMNQYTIENVYLKKYWHLLVPSTVLSNERGKVRLFLPSTDNLVGITKEQNSIWTEGHFREEKNVGIAELKNKKDKSR